MNILKTLRLPLLGALLAVSDSFAGAEVVTVVARNNPATALTRREVSNIFFGKSSRFPAGGHAAPIDQPENSPARTEFYYGISGKTQAEVKAHWSKMIVTGRGQPPRVVRDDAAVKDALASQPDGIGYIGREAVDATVKVLAVE